MQASQTDYLQATKNHFLHYEYFHNSDSDMIFIIAHGLNEHSGRYHHVVKELLPFASIFIYDHRGHGKSDGIRSHVEDFKDYVLDMRCVFDFIKQNFPRKKIGLIAHSMGGQIAVNFVATLKKNDLEFLILSSPNLKIAWKVNFIKEYLGLKLVHKFPKLRLPNEVGAKWISTDLAEVKKYKSDPLNNKAITLKLGIEIIKNQEQIMHLSKRFHLPTLILHAGYDRICDNRASEAFFKEIPAAKKQFKIYDGFYHEIFNEVKKDLVFEDIKTWIKANSFC